MLHLRVTCPGERTDELAGTILGTSGTASLVVQRGVVVRAGAQSQDLVEADVARESADHLLVLLERAGAYDQGTVTFVELDMARGEAVTRAEREAPGQGVDAVVWSQLVGTTGEQARLSSTFMVFLVVATLIASVGLLTDSQVLIVGAMVLGPEFTALASLAVSIVDRDVRSALLALRTVVVGFVAATVVTGGAVALLYAAGQVPADYLDGRRPLTQFIASPDAFSVAVALLAGVAGTVSLTASKSSALVGVFISVTTVPAAAEVAAAAVTGQDDKAWAAAVMLAINIASILVAAVATLLAQRAVWAALEARRGQVDPAATSADPDRGTRPHPVHQAPVQPWQHLRDAAQQVRGTRRG